MAGDNFASTIQAVIALELKTLPFATMDAGAATEEMAEEQPVTLPETGGATSALTLVLLVGGAALSSIGLALRRRL
jgi:LPXTG-motif cell wall-anchored protein